MTADRAIYEHGFGGNLQRIQVLERFGSHFRDALMQGCVLKIVRLRFRKRFRQQITPWLIKRLSQRFARWRTRSEDTRLNSSHVAISYAVFCFKKKNTTHYISTTSSN